MRREAEFRNYLINFRKRHKHSPSGAERYVKICHRIESYMGGRDMEELVISQAEVNATKKVLETKGSFTDTRAVLHAYHEFASSTTTGWTPVSSTTPSTTKGGIGIYRAYPDVAGLVVYENSVPNGDHVSGLCEFVEEEYEKIRAFARRLLMNIGQDFPAVPVYLSKERPEKTYYYNREFLLEKMREYCSKCDKHRCEPPYCGVSEVLERYAPFTDCISGRFYDCNEPHIVLYFKNFSKPHDMSNNQFKAAIKQTLAHEYMHYLHYVHADKEYNNAKKELKEALADFFGVLYSIHRGQKDDLRVAKARYNSWKKNFGTYWPYANALYFYQVHGKEMKFSSDYKQYEDCGCIGKFIEVFGNASYPDDAYKAMKEI